LLCVIEKKVLRDFQMLSSAIQNSAGYLYWDAQATFNREYIVTGFCATNSFKSIPVKYLNL
jgi:hypothetical protein